MESYRVQICSVPPRICCFFPWKSSHTAVLCRGSRERNSTTGGGPISRRCAEACQNQQQIQPPQWPLRRWINNPYWDDKIHVKQMMLFLFDILSFDVGRCQVLPGADHSERSRLQVASFQLGISSCSRNTAVLPLNQAFGKLTPHQWITLSDTK